MGAKEGGVQLIKMERDERKKTYMRVMEEHSLQLGSILYASDGRAFPATGVNPMITIHATAAYRTLKICNSHCKTLRSRETQQALYFSL